MRSTPRRFRPSPGGLTGCCCRAHPSGRGGRRRRAGGDWRKLYAGAASLSPDRCDAGRRDGLGLRDPAGVRSWWSGAGRRRTSRRREQGAARPAHPASRRVAGRPVGLLDAVARIESHTQGSDRKDPAVDWDLIQVDPGNAGRSLEDRALTAMEAEAPAILTGAARSDARAVQQKAFVTDPPR